MKTFAAVLALMIASSVVAQTTDTSYFSSPQKYLCIDATEAASKYLPALSSGNPGVVESGLAHLAMIKLMMPACDMKAVQKKVSGLAGNASSVEIRYKAFLTNTVMENPALFVHVAQGRYNDPDELFSEVASSMSRYLAAR